MAICEILCVLRVLQVALHAVIFILGFVILGHWLYLIFLLWKER